MCALSTMYGFYYAAHGGMLISPSNKVPFVDEKRQGHIRGVAVDIVKDAFVFTPEDMAASPAKLHAMTSSTPSDTEPNLGLRKIWLHAYELGMASKTAYGSDWLTAFSLTLIAGLMNRTSAEENIKEHRRDFAAYFRLWLHAVFGANPRESEDLHPTPARLGDEGESTQKDNNGEGSVEAGGDAEKYFVHYKDMCEGNSFFFTEKGYFGMGSENAKPGDHISVLFGGKCPCILRERRKRETVGRRYKLLLECYVHGLMRGEAMEKFKRGELSEESYIVC